MSFLNRRQEPRKIEISHRTIIFSVFFLIGLYFLYSIRDIIIGLFISILLSTALNPLVTKLERFKIPRSVSVIVIYALIVSAIIFFVSAIAPPLIDQTNNLLKAIPLDSVSEQFQPIEVNLENINLLTQQLGSFFPLVRIVTSTFSGLIAVFTFMVITYYILLERKDLHKHLVFLFGSSEKKAEEYVDQVDKRIGSWVRGELVLMIVVGALTYVGLLLLNVPYALPLAIIAGFLEIVPNIGPAISAIPAIFVTLASSQKPLMVVFVLALYILIQQLENNFIVPKVMQKAVGVHPLLTIVLIIVGLKIAGIAGAILAVPVYLVSIVSYNLLIEPQIQKTH